MEHFERIISYPKPLQQPHPPILFGDATARGRDCVVRYCNGWIPIDVLLDDLPAALADLHCKALAAGRNPANLSVSVFAFETTQSDTLKRYRDLGIARVVLVAPRRLADALPFLDRLARIIPDIASSI
jgi:alkanesulfonate monooxygenase SsuD/methylene tetrahydromethanopterin reductase-like flavin-dependent oxidoreductase (luciferase family)